MCDMLFVVCICKAHHNFIDTEYDVAARSSGKVTVRCKSINNLCLFTRRLAK